MNSITRQQLNRSIVGILSIVSLLSGLAIGITDSWNNLWCGSFIRAGLLSGAFWIGMPTRGRAAAWANVNPWTTVAAVALLVFVMRVVRRPQVLIPIGVALVFLIYVAPLITGGRKRG